MAKLLVNRRHYTPKERNFASLECGELFVRVASDLNRILIKVTEKQYRELHEDILFSCVDLSMACYVVEELEVTYSLKYE